MSSDRLATAQTVWPSPLDYMLVIQDCQHAFADTQLQKGQVVCDSAQGLPLAVSGNFAVVFHLTCKKGRNKRHYAVRCFIRPVHDHQERYRKLSEYLAERINPNMVEFDYQAEGIRVNDGGYPIVKMRWVEGLKLDEFIDQSVQSGDVKHLEKLCKMWVRLMERLRECGIGHGDLQHGNVLVNTPGNHFYLVDYDGIYIPSLSHQPPGEVGHRNYQHPERIANGYYAANVDSFSSLVIYLSLLAVSADPSVWKRFHQEDGLIFFEQDFKNPGATEIWQYLLASEDERVRRLTQRLINCCKMPPDCLPPPDEILKVDTDSFVVEPSQRISSPAPADGLAPNLWIMDYFLIDSQPDRGSTLVSGPGSPNFQQPVAGTGDESWLEDHISTAPPPPSSLTPVEPTPSTTGTVPTNKSSQGTVSSQQPANTYSQPAPSLTTNASRSPLTTSSSPQYGCSGYLIAAAVVIVCGILKWLGIL